MKKLTFDTDYRKLRFSNITSKQFRHILLLLFWPIFGATFAYAERGYNPGYYYPMHCALDDVIPFNEFFVIPYVFWFAFLAGTLAYTFFFDIETFTRMMKFIIVTYTAALVVFFIFPNCQHLRPTVFERDNILTRFMADFYVMDTNTNVCPSIHVIGSIGTMLAGLRCKKLQFPWAKLYFITAAILISMSTVFLKQHSVIDVVAALPVCLCGFLLFFYEPRANKRKKAPVAY